MVSRAGIVIVTVLPAFAPWPPGQLTPRENQAAHRIPTRRGRYEFMRSRVLIHYLTGSEESFLSSEHKPPLWPQGITASLSHKRGHVAFVMEKSSRRLGVDLEKHRPLSQRVQERIFSTAELKLIQQQKALEPSIHFDILCFSAKESILKSLHGYLTPLSTWKKVEIKKISTQKKTITASSPCGIEVSCQWRFCMDKHWIVCVSSTKTDPVDGDKMLALQTLPSKQPDLDIEGLAQSQQNGLDQTEVHQMAYLKP